MALHSMFMFFHGCCLGLAVGAKWHGAAAFNAAMFIMNALFYIAKVFA